MSNEAADILEDIRESNQDLMGCLDQSFREVRRTLGQECLDKLIMASYQAGKQGKSANKGKNVQTKSPVSD